MSAKCNKRIPLREISAIFQKSAAQAPFQNLKNCADQEQSYFVVTQIRWVLAPGSDPRAAAFLGGSWMVGVEEGEDPAGLNRGSYI